MNSEDKVLSESSDRRMNHRVFTLIELLVVIAIIMILMAILFPVLRKAKEMGYRAVCKNNLKQQYLAINSYAEDFNQNLPEFVNRYDHVYQATANAWQGVAVEKNSVEYFFMQYLTNNKPVLNFPNHVFYREILQCPSFSLWKTGSENTCKSLGYSFVGFGQGRNVTTPIGSTRFFNMATRAHDGVTVALVHDCTIIDPEAINPWGVDIGRNLFNHRRQGGNVVDTTGSVQWVPIKDWRVGYYQLGVPNNFFVQRGISVSTGGSLPYYPSVYAPVDTGSKQDRCNLFGYRYID